MLRHLCTCVQIIGQVAIKAARPTMDASSTPESLRRLIAKCWAQVSPALSGPQLQHYALSAPGYLHFRANFQVPEPKDPSLHHALPVFIMDQQPCGMGQPYSIELYTLYIKRFSSSTEQAHA